MRTINFLKQGTYTIAKVTKQEGIKGIEFIANVGRWSYNQWISEVIDLSYLFKPNAIGPILRYQPETLLDHVINVTERKKHQTQLGKNYYSYVWEINIKATQILQEELHQFDYDECEEQELYYLEELESNSIEYDRQLVLEEQDQHLLEEQERQENIEEN